MANIAVIGSGGREYALYWKLKQYNHKVYVLPGNGGVSDEDRVNIAVNDFQSIEQFVKEHNINLVVVGPEDPLVSGIADYLSPIVPVFGPTKDGAKLEGSKIFAKEFMKKYNIPTADFSIAKSKEEALAIVQNKFLPIVLKADGLAAGKGVIIANTIEEIEEALNKYFVDKVFGEAGNRILIEDFIEGDEASIFVITDGRDYIVLPSSQDHKRVYDNDKGPNTGGMGAYSPTPLITKELFNTIEAQIIKPTIQGINKENMNYKGVVYIGLIIKDNQPYVLEYNCRFGDPETQVVLPLIEDDLYNIFLSAAQGQLNSKSLKIKDEFYVGVVMASGGYPGSYKKGYPIEIKDLKNNSLIFYAGVEKKDNQLITAGGRVLMCVNADKDIKIAIDKVYEDIKSIVFTDAHYRTDIAYRALKYIKN